MISGDFRPVSASRPAELANSSGDGVPVDTAELPDSPDPPRPSSPRSSATRHTPWKTVLNYWLDGLLALMFLCLAWVTAVVQFVFPRGPTAWDAMLWGLDFAGWRDLQFGLVAALGCGVLLHIMLHWNWICSVTNTHVRGRSPGRDNGTRTLLGVAVLVAILHVMGIGLLAAWWALEHA